MIVIVFELIMTFFKEKDIFSLPAVIVCRETFEIFANVDMLFNKVYFSEV